MNSKQQGSIGELAVAFDLTKRGYTVFTTTGVDNSMIDIIAAKDKKLIRLQVKTQKNTAKGTITIPRRAKSIGWEHVYTKEDFDYVASYAVDRDCICYIPIKILENYSRGLTIRFDPPKNNMKIKNHARDYADL